MGYGRLLYFAVLVALVVVIAAIGGASWSS
jgi:hypothetical protein